jgi:hypothetical protein
MGKMLMLPLSSGMECCQAAIVLIMIIEAMASISLPPR